jgi:glycosyltransferase involved in cell wall biosynthesis
VTRVFFTHRYSMEQVKSLCASGEFPRHHLWGADALERAGDDVQYGFFGQSRRTLRHVSWRLGDRLGDIEQEAVIWRRARRGDVIYAGEASLLRGLAQLRRARCAAPLVAVVHSAGPWISGIDVAVCLSSRMRSHLVSSYGRDPAVTPLASWGPDLDFPRYTATGEEVIVSAGKTERDVDTLLLALEDLGLRARVYVDESQAAPTAPGVEMVRTRAARGIPLHYPTVLEDLRRASVVAIPLRHSDRLLGLSEINDALALAKPIVMTRTDAIDFDAARVGCGFSVEPYDVAGWREALGSLAGDPALRSEMGKRGREFAERGYNANVFGASIVAAVRTATELAGFG